MGGAPDFFCNGVALVDDEGRLVDFDEEFVVRLAATGGEARLGTDVSRLLQGEHLALGGTSEFPTSSLTQARWRLEPLQRFHSGAVLYRLSNAGPIAGPTPVREHSDDLFPLRAAVTATAASVRRARRENERRLHSKSIEITARSAELAEENRHLHSLSTTDPLTGLLNRRGFEELSTAMWSDAGAKGGSFGVVLLDIDGFKAYNDSFGHLAGDDCLRSVSVVLSDTTRSADVLARYGGEEFIVVVADADADGHASASAAERLRAAVESLGRVHPSRGIVTVSAGYHSVVPTAGASVAEVLHCADQALYIAKESGRNRVAGWNSTMKLGHTS